MDSHADTTSGRLKGLISRQQEYEKSQALEAAELEREMRASATTLNDHTQKIEAAITKAQGILAPKMEKDLKELQGLVALAEKSEQEANISSKTSLADQEQRFLRIAPRFAAKLANLSQLIDMRHAQMLSSMMTVHNDLEANLKQGLLAQRSHLSSQMDRLREMRANLTSDVQDNIELDQGLHHRSTLKLVPITQGDEEVDAQTRAVDLANAHYRSQMVGKVASLSSDTQRLQTDADQQLQALESNLSTATATAAADGRTLGGLLASLTHEEDAVEGGLSSSIAASLRSINASHLSVEAAIRHEDSASEREEHQLEGQLDKLDEAEGAEQEALGAAFSRLAGELRDMEHQRLVSKEEADRTLESLNATLGAMREQAAAASRRFQVALGAEEGHEAADFARAKGEAQANETAAEAAVEERFQVVAAGEEFIEVHTPTADA